MAYDSPINNGLDQRPSSEDPAFFLDMFKAYNAIHILTQVVSDQIEADNPPESEWPGIDPATSAQFKQFVYSQVGVFSAFDGVLEGGSLVTWDGFGKVRPAGDGNTSPGRMGSQDAYGMALTGGPLDAWVKIGVLGPVINITGIQAGQVYLQSPFGRLTSADGYFGTLYVAGIGVRDDRFLFYPHMIVVADNTSSD